MRQECQAKDADPKDKDAKSVRMPRKEAIARKRTAYRMHFQAFHSKPHQKKLRFLSAWPNIIHERSPVTADPSSEDEQNKPLKSRQEHGRFFVHARWLILCFLDDQSE